MTVYKHPASKRDKWLERKDKTKKPRAAATSSTPLVAAMTQKLTLKNNLKPEMVATENLDSSACVCDNSVNAHI